MAINTATKHGNFISRSVQGAIQFKAAYDQMLALREEWDSLAYSTGIVDADFVGNNVYLNAAALVAFYTAQSSLVTYWTSGNGTNVSTLVP